MPLFRVQLTPEGAQGGPTTRDIRAQNVTVSTRHATAEFTSEGHKIAILAAGTWRQIAEVPADDPPTPESGDVMSRVVDGLHMTPSMEGAFRLLVCERVRQIIAEGRTSKHDDEHDAGELAAAAACYALPGHSRAARGDFNVPAPWPFEPQSWKPSPADRVRELVKAGALIVAEIQRLERAGVTTQEIPPA